MPVISIEEARRRGIIGGGAKKKQRRPEPSDSLKPHDAVVLGVDIGRVSGWGILLRDGETWEDFLRPPGQVKVWCGEGRQYSAANVIDEWWSAIGHAQNLARLHKVPLIVVMETWTQGSRANDRRMNAMVLLGLGGVRETWKRLLKSAAHPAKRIVSVNTSTWRSKVLGGPMNRKSAAWKVAAQQYVRGRFAVEAGENAAEAVCIAAYGSHMGRAGATIVKGWRHKTRVV